MSAPISYPRLLRIPGAAAFFTWGLIGRFPAGTLGIASLLLVQHQTGSYAQAGVVTACLTLGGLVARPLWSRAMDRHGQRRPLLIAATANLVSSALLAVLVLIEAPSWTWWMLALAAGASLPSLGSVTRTRWRVILGGGPEAKNQMHGALALESIADEAVFVLGPPMATLLAAMVHPVAGFAVGMLLGFLGSAALASRRDTEPDLVPARQRDGSLGVPGPILALLPAFVGVGVIFASLDLGVIALAETWGSPAMAGLLLGAFAAANGVAGAVYGLIRFTSSARQRAAVAGVVVLLATASTAVATTPLGVLASLVVIGAALSPLMIAGMAVAAEAATVGRLNEMMTWPAVGIGVGAAAAATGTGALISATTPAHGFWVTVAGGVLAASAAIVLAAPRKPARHTAVGAAPSRGHQTETSGASRAVVVGG